MTVITVNYNSSKIKDIASQCIKAILNLDYRPLEIIVVDNGPTDGSFEYIKSMIKDLAPRDVKVKLLELSKNYGFAGANCKALKLMDKQAKYVALINNDLAPEPGSLRKLIEFLEGNIEVAGVQGKILTWEGDKIDDAGPYLTQLGNTYVKGYMMQADTNNTEAVVSYVDGAYSVYRIEAVLKAGGLFYPDFFLYGDDCELGIRLWKSGYAVKYVPILAGKHFRGATFKQMKDWQEYFSRRSEIAMTIIHDRFWIVKLMLRLPMIIGVPLLRRQFMHSYTMRGVFDGILLGFRLYKKVNRTGLNRVPKIKLPLIKWYAILLKLALKYGKRAERIQYAVISRYYLENLYEAKILKWL